MVNHNRFYTYAYLREDKTPYYIGKGKDNRLYRKNKKDIKPPKDKSRVIFLKQNLTEEEAFKHEKYMIAVFGRKDLETGILHNRTDGGEGASGKITSDEVKIKIGNANRGKKSWCAGKKLDVSNRKLPNNSRTVKGINPEGKIYVWKSASLAARSLGFKHSSISRCARKERKTYKGWTWIYV